VEDIDYQTAKDFILRYEWLELHSGVHGFGSLHPDTIDLMRYCGCVSRQESFNLRRVGSHPRCRASSSSDTWRALFAILRVDS
jgi:hypothetical protein